MPNDFYRVKTNFLKSVRGLVLGARDLNGVRRDKRFEISNKLLLLLWSQHEELPSRAFRFATMKTRSPAPKSVHDRRVDTDQSLGSPIAVVSAILAVLLR